MSDTFGPTAQLLAAVTFDVGDCVVWSNRRWRVHYPPPCCGLATDLNVYLVSLEPQRGALWTKHGIEGQQVHAATWVPAIECEREP